jgi:hypothetical protein
VIGEYERFDEIWRSMEEIDGAHRRAGHWVRLQLENEIRKADRNGLAMTGWQDFDVAEIEGEGALRVARIEGRSPSLEQVSRNRTRRLFELDRDLWPE